MKVILSDNAETITKAFTALTALTSVLVYIYKRQRIPRLSFGGYFKVEQVFITGNAKSKVTTYYVKIEHINPKREGKIKSFVGYLIVGSEGYSTTWMSINTSQHTFVKQAGLKLFDIKKIDSVLTFGIGDCMSLIGNYSKILIERLCIRTLLSERHGGFGSP